MPSEPCPTSLRAALRTDVSRLALPCAVQRFQISFITAIPTWLGAHKQRRAKVESSPARIPYPFQHSLGMSQR
eukprot:4817644-Prymnesium_polylepis.1